MITEHGATHRHALEEALGQVAHYALYHGDLDTIIPIPVIIPEHPHTRREWKTHLRKAVCHCLPRVVGYGHHAHLNIAIAVKVNVSFGIIGGRKPIGKGFSDTIAPIVSKEHRIVNPALIISYVIIYSPKNMWTGWIGLPIQDIATVRCNDKFRIPFAIGIEVRRPYPTRINFDSPDARARARPGRAHVVAEPAEGAGNEATTGGGIVNAGDEDFHNNFNQMEIFIIKTMNKSHNGRPIVIEKTIEKITTENLLGKTRSIIFFINNSPSPPLYPAR